MFSKIRAALHTLTAPANSKTIVPAGVRSVTVQQLPEHVRTQSTRASAAPMKGDFHVSHLDLISSVYLRQAISNLGAWSALARGFAAYDYVCTRPRATREKLEAAVNEFHCWNASLPLEKQMQDEEILVTLAKMAETAVPKGDANTDAIIARVRKCSVEELRNDRMKQAEKASARKQELIIGFMAELETFSDGDLDPSLPIAKAAGKVLQTMEWVATKWQGEPVGIAAELLLIEGDQAIIEAMAKAGEEKTTEREEVSGHRRFGDERSEATRHVQDDQETKKHDYAAYQQWVIDQQNAA